MHQAIQKNNKSMLYSSCFERYFLLSPCRLHSEYKQRYSSRCSIIHSFQPFPLVSAFNCAFKTFTSYRPRCFINSQVNSHIVVICSVYNYYHVYTPQVFKSFTSTGTKRHLVFLWFGLFVCLFLVFACLFVHLASLFLLCWGKQLHTFLGCYSHLEIQQNLTGIK